MNPYQIEYFGSPIKLLNDLTIEYWKSNLREDGEFNLRYKCGEDSVFISYSEGTLYMELSTFLYVRYCSAMNHINSDPSIFRSTIGINFIVKEKQ